MVFTRALLDMFPLAKAIVQGPCSATSAAGPISSRISPCPHLTAERSRPTPGRGRTVVRSVRGNNRRGSSPPSRRGTATSSELIVRRRRHVADPAATPIVRTGRSGSDRAGVERTSESAEPAGTAANRRPPGEAARERAARTNEEASVRRLSRCPGDTRRKVTSDGCHRNRTETARLLRSPHPAAGWARPAELLGTASRRL